MYYIVYKTNNLINNKEYIGCHKQKSMPFEFDGYLGSGILLNRSIKKYGKENFTRETMFVFEDKISAFDKEKELVNLQYILKDDNYNMRIGGEGGDTKATKTKEEIAEISRKVYNTKVKNGTLFDSAVGKANKSKASKKRAKEKPHTMPNNKGRKHTGIALENIRNANRRKDETITITNGSIEVVFCKDKLIPDGWKRGRKDGIKQFEQHSKESKQQIANHPNIKGITCYTNGKENIKLQKGINPPEGFKKGMTKKIKPSFWITNGKESKRIEKTVEIPKDWYKGRTIKKRTKNDNQ